MVPFELAVPDEELADARDRLRRVRLPEAETAGGWAQGIPRSYVEELCRYWREEYDWRRLEAELNGRGQWRTVIDGLGIHFLHVRSPRADAWPLLITHGWPGSVVERGLTGRRIRRGSSPGSWRSSRAGPTVAGIRRTRCPVSGCWTMSRSIGSRRAVRHRRGCTGRAFRPGTDTGLLSSRTARAGAERNPAETAPPSKPFEQNSFAFRRPVKGGEGAAARRRRCEFHTHTREGIRCQSRKC